MNTFELRVKMSVAMNELDRNNLRKSINEILIRYDAPPISVEVNQGSTELVVLWDVAIAAAAIVITAAGVLATSFLKKAGELWATKVMEKSSGENAPKKADAINTLPAPTWEVQHESKPLSEKMQALERAIGDELGKLTLANVLEVPDSVTITRRETVEDKLEDKIIMREQSLVFQDGKIKNIEESMKTTLHASAGK